MMTIDEQQLQGLARAHSAAGRIIEAHSDTADRICRVVIEMGSGLGNAQLREATLQLWMADGFIASVSRDGHYLMIEGLIGQESADTLNLINIVNAQLKRYAQRQSAAGKAENSPELAFLAAAQQSRNPQAFI